MLNGIWGFFLIGGILTGAFLGRMDMVTGAILSGGRSAVELALAMAGVISVWSGVLKIAERGGMIPPCRGCILQENISQRILWRIFWGLDGRQHLPD